ncbi:DEAD/DEAH box helicase [Pseudoalteromonas sp. Angola-31]|nr:DEAD/DEAH box helicase [Pseudoalteromonas sp. Angola-31]
MNDFFSTLKKQANAKAKEATLSVLGINNPSLRNHLNNKMQTDEPFVQGPVFEQMFSWERNTKFQMQDLVNEDLLSQVVVDALDSDINKRYAFKKSWSPFAHQYKAWNDLLAKNVQSRIITSGTGSGKTECFMVPVLEDLYRELAHTKQQLEGVRAIFLYPLNALINSQQERLNAWTQHFNGDIRFCLFNGKTPEHLNSKQKQRQKETPQEVMCRNGLRESPAPILVTNGTMLEYMLVRQTDAPIINKSKGKLRWIVLDEAHTYVGSQAAELALQLRRVMQAFEVKPENIRFVATSATIAGSEAEEKLKTYLASLANISVDQVDVIGGQRVVPPLDKRAKRVLTLDHIMQIEPDGQPPENKKSKQNPDVSKLRYEALESSEIAVSLRSMLTESKSAPKTIKEIQQGLSNFKLSEDEIYHWIDVCSATKPNENDEAFLKLRAHYFQRTLNGLWACIDKNCSYKQNSELKENWPFGNVYSNHRMRCECTVPVLELSFCEDCNEPHLLGAYDSLSHIQQWINSHNDEFSLAEGDREDESQEGENETKSSIYKTSPAVVFSAKENEEHGYSKVDLNKIGQMVFDDGEITLFERNQDTQECASCGYTGRGKSAKAFRRALLGSPFYTTNVVPTILEYCPDFEPDKDNDTKQLGPNELPARGRRLITFTDSRQGTAKISVSMQQEAERSYFRGALVRELKKHIEQKVSVEPEILKRYGSWDRDELVEEIEFIEDRKPELATKLKNYLSDLDSGNNTFIIPKSFSWKEMIEVLKGDTNIAHSMTYENHYLAREIFSLNDATKLSEMILTREVARRPKNRNNVETQGLVKLVYPGIETITQVPEHWVDNNFNLQDWKNYLKVCMDFYVRENTFVGIPDEISRWVGMHFYPKFLISPDSKDDNEDRVKSWPLFNAKSSRQQRIVNLLIKAAKFKNVGKREEDQLNIWLKSAWHDLVKTRTLNEYAGKQYQLNLNTVEFSLLKNAYICPVTNKIIDTVFADLSPYMPANKSSDDYICKPVVLPSIWEFDTSSDNSRYIAEIRKNIANDEKVNFLREQNLWTDINDSAVEGGFYYTTAEHSAQQSSDNLERYEERFKNGQKNVLNCSTTMEMGVDIGGISAVVMNNVPPHPANYLQRAGRAGRSSESRAIGFTICKSNPHDQSVFNNPKWPFTTEIAAPTVTFSSKKIVQRHVNSFLLGTFLREEIGTTDKDRLFLNLQWFYFKGEAEKPVYKKFVDWIYGLNTTLLDEIKLLVQGTVLSSASVKTLCNDAITKIEDLAARWIGEYTYIENELANTDPEGPYGYRLNNDKNRLMKEYLLRDLATRGFLPGYGFPTDVVNIKVDSWIDWKRKEEDKPNNRQEKGMEREDNVSVSRGMPSRNLAVAIREFAPGTELVLDGRVHRSAGISLNWQNIHVEGGTDSQKFDVAWRCDSCGQTGYEADLSKQNDILCSNVKCGQPIKLKNQRKVIQPTGFVVDFYREPTNNIANTHYVPVEAPWVMGKGTHIPLLNPEIGFMVSDSSGNVFHHSSGLHGKGYGVCLSCGKTESMTSTSELPSTLSLEKEHRPPMPTKFQRDEKGKPECTATGKILQEIHLGYNTTTDVFELVLRNPITNEYLNDTSIAITLAVALRKALVNELGIAVNEVGYGSRPTLIDKSAKGYAIQLFDMVSGGAGFSISAKDSIETLLQKARNILDCDEGCERFCHKCLLESDSRHDIDLLNRKAALEWLDNIQKYIALPDEYQQMLGHGVPVKYVAGTLKEKLSELIRGKPSVIKFIFAESVDEWDTSVGQYKSLFHSYLADQIKVQVMVPDADFNKEVAAFLSELESIGVELFSTQTNFPVAFQAISDQQCITIANLDKLVQLPGDSWLISDDITIQTEKYPEVTGQLVTFKAEKEAGVAEISVLDELNGPLIGFGKRLLTHLMAVNSDLEKLLTTKTLQSMTYTDRYIQSPTSMMMLSELLSAIPGSNHVAIDIITCFTDKKAPPGYAIQHDWIYEDDYKGIFTAWLQYNCSEKAKLNLVNKHEVPHRRSLTLQFDGGDKSTITFDQGVGYWRVVAERGLHKLDFNQAPQQQLVKLAEVLGKARIVNSANWETWFTVSSVK